VRSEKSVKWPRSENESTQLKNGSTIQFAWLTSRLTLGGVLFKSSASRAFSVPNISLLNRARHFSRPITPFPNHQGSGIQPIVLFRIDYGGIGVGWCPSVLSLGSDVHGYYSLTSTSHGQLRLTEWMIPGQVAGCRPHAPFACIVAWGEAVLMFL
jgi:hypothetical protein